MRHQLDEVEKKQDIMLWKIAKIESMTDVRTSQTTEDIRGRPSMLDKSPLCYENDPKTTPKSTPKRVYTRRPGSNMPGRPPKSPVITQCREDATKIAAQATHGRKDGRVDNMSGSKTYEKNVHMQGRMHNNISKPVEKDKINPVSSSFNVSFHPKV